jgi:hypothetical protein
MSTSRIQNNGFSNSAKFWMVFAVFGMCAAFALFLARAHGSTTVGVSVVSPRLDGANSGLLAHYTFDGKDMTTGQVNDVSGNGNNGSMEGMATATAYTRGVIGGALAFDGGNDDVTMANGPSISTDATVSGWFYWDSTDHDAASLIRDATASGGWILGYGAAGVTGNTLHFRVGNSTFDTGVSTSTVQDRWTFYAMTKNGSNVAYYIDGQQVYTGTGSASAASILPWYIMKNGTSGGTRIKGMADEVRFYDRALSPDEIALLYQEVESPATIDSTITAPRLDDTNSGLIAHYTFDGKDMTTGQVNDVSGHGNDGSLTGVATETMFTRGVIGQALNFDVNGGSGTFNIRNFQDLSSTLVTASAWVNIPTPVGPVGGYRIITNNWVNSGWLLWVSSANGRASFVTAQGGAQCGSNSAPVLSPNTWYLLTGTYDGAKTRLYVNGVLTDTDPCTVTAFDNTGLIKIQDTNIGQPIALDDIRIYNRALSDDEVDELYEEGSGGTISSTPEVAPLDNIDAGLVGHWTFDGKDTTTGTITDTSGSGNNGSMQNMATATAFTRGVIGQAISLNGTTNAITLGTPASLTLTTGTESAWIKTKNAGVSYRGIVTKSGAYGMYLTGNIFSTYDNGAVSLRSTGVNLADGTWHFVAMSFQSGVTNGTILYIDGEPSLTTTITNTGNNTVRIGLGQGAGQYFNGAIDDARIYNRILSPDEIKQLYQMGQ